MIDSITLENFQSHKDVTVEFSPGINVFTGESDQGKTAILRAIYMARYNKPTILPSISHWALNDKGNQKETTSITVIKNGITLKREKSTKFNGYIIGDKKLAALGKGGLPEEVIKFFNMTEVNIQKQMDAPFLIGNSPSEIAKFLNTIVDMTEIDTYLHAAQVKKNGNNKELKRLVKETEDLEKQLEGFNSLDAAEILLRKLKKVQKRKATKIEDTEVLTELMNNYTTIQEKLAVDTPYQQIEVLLKKIKPVLSKINTKTLEKTILQNLIDSYNTTTFIIEESTDVTKMEVLLKKISPIIQKKKETTIKAKKLRELITHITSEGKLIETTIKKVTELESKLPATCPLCGAKMKKEK